MRVELKAEGRNSKEELYVDVKFGEPSASPYNQWLYIGPCDIFGTFLRKQMLN